MCAPPPQFLWSGFGLEHITCLVQFVGNSIGKRIANTLFQKSMVEYLYILGVTANQNSVKNLQKKIKI